MINVQLGKLVSSEKALERLTELRPTMKVGYAIKKALEKIFPEIEKFKRVVNESIADKYGKPNASGNMEVTKENEEAFKTEIDELWNSEISLDMLKLSLPDTLEMKVEDLFVLEWLIEAQQ